MTYTRDAAASTIRRLLGQLDEAATLEVESFVVRLVLEQQDALGNEADGNLCAVGASQNSAPGRAGPNQAGADGNGAAGQTFSPAPSALSPEHSHANGAGTFFDHGAAAEHAIKHGHATVVRRDGSPRVVIAIPKAERDVLAGLRELRDACPLWEADMVDDGGEG